LNDGNLHGVGVRKKSSVSEQYVFAELSGRVIRQLVSDDSKHSGPTKNQVIQEAVEELVRDETKRTALVKKIQDKQPRAIYHVWPDFPVRGLINASISTVKADAAHAAFSAYGQGIVWAVLDSGIDVNHRHFQKHDNLDPEPPVLHEDFTGEDLTDEDPYGHGTHVAGIIAGEVRLGSEQVSDVKQGRRSRKKEPGELLAAVRNRAEDGETTYSDVKLRFISGMAPRCKLVNMRVLDAEGNGEVSSLISAIAKIQEINGYGRRLLIHGVNISIGNDFEPEWFACGQSPLCVEVDRLVKSGVVVVVAAGNSGYGTLSTDFTGDVKMGMDLTINDPGNAQFAITVGSTHRDMPHTYGVSYFSSKGPTGDGRLKPDLVAPGEKVISCAAGKAREDIEGDKAYEYVENSGTSMAAPHVSGVIAAFLSVRREFIGQPEKVKEIFMSAATDLQRERYFQGSGLVDLMRAIQSV
jgi:subtilisin family serine protease